MRATRTIRWMALGGLVLGAGHAGRVHAQQPPSDLVTITGCVEPGPRKGQVTVTDADGGRYLATGNDVRRYAGRRIQATGTVRAPRVAVRGGLWPSPNVAASGGSFDPVKSAMAQQPGGGSRGTGNPEVALPQLTIKSITALDGGCR